MPAMQGDGDRFGDGARVGRHSVAAGFGAGPGAASTANPPPPPPPPPGGSGPGSWSGGPGWAPPGWGGPPAWPPLPGTAAPAPRPPVTRRRALFIAAAIFGALVIAAASGTVTALLVRGGSSPAAAPPSQSTSPTPGPATTQARTAYRQMLSAAEASSGYHYVSASSFLGQSVSRESMIGDAGRNDGTQVITLSSTYGTEQFTLRLTGDGSVYFQGNTPALEDQIGVVASAAPALVGKWVLVTVGDGPYQQLEAGITVASHLQGDELTPSSLASVATASGTAERISGSVEQNGTVIQGASAHFDVATTSKLPQTYVESDPSLGLSTTDSFSKWGSAPTVSAPSGAVAWSSLHTQAPPGGYGNGGAQGGTPSPSPSTPSPSGGSV